MAIVVKCFPYLQIEETEEGDGSKTCGHKDA